MTAAGSKWDTARSVITAAGWLPLPARARATRTPLSWRRPTSKRVPFGWVSTVMPDSRAWTALYSRFMAVRMTMVLSFMGAAFRWRGVFDGAGHGRGYGRAGTGAEQAGRAAGACPPGVVGGDDEAAGALDLAVEIPRVKWNPPDGLIDPLEVGNREGRAAEGGGQCRVLQLPAR